MNKILLLIASLLLLTGCASTNIGLVDSSSFDNTTIKTQSKIIPNYDLLVSTDRAVGVQAQIYSAHNPDVDNSGSKEDIWEGGGLMTYLDVAQKMVIVSTDADDTDQGTGAWGIFLICLNSNWDFVQELIPLNGTTPVVSTVECLRPRSISVIQAGSSGFNEGTITATSQISGDLQDQMNPEESTSKNVHISVPRGFTLILDQLLLSTTKTGGQTPIVEFKGKFTLGNVPNASWIQSFDVKLDTAVTDYIIIPNNIQNEINEMSDFRIEVTTSHDNTDVNARLWWYFINNSELDAHLGLD